MDENNVELLRKHEKEKQDKINSHITGLIIYHLI